ncbi:hypothetical protein [Candidatus Poriferisodalis sp.]|uniref:hypothetical protein n=1 Tax=Candidatus Poriferisodalis sp. TaxID=3101277 RepID=UPI003D0E4AFB
MSAHARRATQTRRSRDEAGGAVTLLVMLMVPVCVFAAVVAAAVPRRLAAESAADAAAENLASLAVAWRDAQGRDYGPVGWFFPDCAPLDHDTGDGDLAALGHELQHACETLTESLLTGLSGSGLDGMTVAGFYSSAYAASAHATTPNGDHPASLPCHAGGRAVVADAVHLGLAADWATTDWAASQVWPRGLPISTEAIGTLPLPAAAEATPQPACGDLLDLAPLDARPENDNAARIFAESLPTRTAFGG